MNREESIKILAVLKANYSNFYKGLARVDAEAMVNLWQEMFSDTPYEVVGAAVKAYIATDTLGYPPNVGKIKELIRKLTQPEEMTEQEAIQLIIKACSNSIYHAQEEFEKLPPVLKRLAGSPSQLREWAMMDSERLNSVVASNLMRSYKVIAERERQHQALPSEMRNLISGMSQKMLLESYEG